MSLYLLDTDTLSLVRYNNTTVTAAIATARLTGHTVGLAGASVEEQMRGWLAAVQTAKTPARLAHASRLLAEAVPLWAQFPIFPMTESALCRFEQLVRLRLNVGRMDLRIAAVALDAGATVVTHNVRDFRRVPGLAVEDWTEPPAAGP
jgi:tRNA(fMet)-specific endonuclease VapC